MILDAFRQHRDTASSILMDEATNKAVGAGMINGPVNKDTHVVWHSSSVTRQQRAYQGATIWLTGLSGSGKFLIAVESERSMVAEGRLGYLMDGDNLYHGLNSDPGFTDDDRRANNRRTAEVAALFAVRTADRRGCRDRAG